RHTRSLRDWSSDVCSSDLKRRAIHSCREEGPGALEFLPGEDPTRPRDGGGRWRQIIDAGHEHAISTMARPRAPEQRPDGDSFPRSEERRVGKECRWRETLA